MYLFQQDAVQRLWGALRRRLEELGVAGCPVTLTWPQDYHVHWLEPDLLMSQTCGYPFIDDLAGRVQLIGSLKYDLPACDGIFCRSVLVARTEHAGLPLEQFRGMRCAFNAPNSQSGYNAFRALVAPLARDGQFFSAAVETGSHLRSIAAVRAGQADLASIDCVSHAGFERYSPQELDGLCVVGQTAAYPGLPLITAAGTAPHHVKALRAAWSSLFQSGGASDACEGLFIRGFEPTEATLYQICADMRDAAIAAGYPRL
jgi:ABC-type phosphate/phosphonate transport system substrate-binding protein